MEWKMLEIALAFVLIFYIFYSLYRHVSDSYLQNDPMILDLHTTLKTFLSRDKKWNNPLEQLNTRNVMNEISIYKGYKSYTINKEKIYLCLLDENGSYYNKNMLIFVLLHEIAHVLSNSVGHTQEFHDIFEALIAQATDDGVYDPKLTIDPNYCGYNVK